MRRRKALLLSLLAILVSLLGCTMPTPMPTNAPEPTSVPTDTPLLTSTSTSTPTPTATSVPTSTSRPTNTPEPTNTPVPPTATPKPFVIQATVFQPNVSCDCNTGVDITSVEGDTFGITVSSGVLSWCDGAWALWCKGATHRWIGTLSYAGYTFASDADNPLQFMVIQSGYLYIRGMGTVTFPDGTVYSLP
jgi:hypothetical protein